MTQPIIKLFMFRNTEAYFQASQAERDEVLGKLDAAFQKAGGKRIIMCNSGWSSEEWPYFGIEQFPSIEALQEYSDAISELNLLRYLVSKTMLGTEMQ